MDTNFDLDKLRLPASMVPPPAPPKRPLRHRQGQKFLKGPIPWAWLGRAFLLPGKALHVSLLLWQVAGYSKGRTVRFCLDRVLSHGLDRQAARRGLRQLQAAGLVQIEHRPGCGLRVTLLDLPESADSSPLPTAEEPPPE